MSFFWRVLVKWLVCVCLLCSLYSVPSFVFLFVLLTTTIYCRLQTKQLCCVFSMHVLSLWLKKIIYLHLSGILEPLHSLLYSYQFLPFSFGRSILSLETGKKRESKVQCWFKLGVKDRFFLFVLIKGLSLYLNFTIDLFIWLQLD